MCHHVWFKVLAVVSLSTHNQTAHWCMVLGSSAVRLDQPELQSYLVVFYQPTWLSARGGSRAQVRALPNV